MSISNHANKVSVVIVTYNGSKWIQMCLDSLRKSTVKSQIIVVDNCSADSTTEIVAKFFPEVLLIKSDKNLGFGHANNLGIGHAIKTRSNYIFLLNQDTTVEEKTIESLLLAFERNENGYGVLSPVHLDDSGNNLDSGFLAYVEKDLPPDKINDLITADHIQEFEVRFVNAAAWMVKVDVFRDIGGFAPLFFHYGEDRDFINRMRYNGIKIGITSATRICHFRVTRDLTVFSWPFRKMTNYYFTGWVTRAADINNSWWLGWASGFTWVLKESLMALSRGNVRVIVAFLVVLAKTVRALSNVLEHRRAVRYPLPYRFLQ